jgi:hypothetical protein
VVAYCVAGAVYASSHWMDRAGEHGIFGVLAYLGQIAGWPMMLVTHAHSA